MAEELAVVSCDHGSAIPDEIHRAVTQGGGLPRVGDDGSGAVDGFGDLAIAGAMATTVSGAEHVPESAPLLRGEAPVRWDRQMMQGAIEPSERFDAIEAIAVERDQGRE